MKPSTQARIERIIDLVDRDADNLRLESALLTILKEQDKDARHACAEAVAWLPDLSDNCTGLISASDAHAACINTQSI